MQVLELSWLGWIVASIIVCWALPGRWRPWGIAAFALAFLVVTDPPSAAILAAAATDNTGKSKAPRRRSFQ